MSIVTPAFERRNYHYLRNLDGLIYNAQQRGIYEIELVYSECPNYLFSYLESIGYTVTFRNGDIVKMIIKW